MATKFTKDRAVTCASGIVDYFLSMKTPLSEVNKDFFLVEVYTRLLDFGYVEVQDDN